MSAVHVVVRKRGEGKVIAPRSHGQVTIKVADETVTIYETRREEGDSGGPRPHSHPGFAETLYVISGMWEFAVGDRDIFAEAGTLVHVPRGVFHSFHSTGTSSATLLGIAVPGGVEDVFEESGRD